MEISTSVLTIGTCALAIAATSLAIDITSLAIDSTSLAIDSTSLAIDTSSLTIDTTSLAIDAISLAIDAISLAIDAISLAIDVTSLAIGMNGLTDASALKARHMIAQGNALGPTVAKPFKPCKGGTTRAEGANPGSPWQRPGAHCPKNIQALKGRHNFRTAHPVHNDPP